MNKRMRSGRGKGLRRRDGSCRNLQNNRSKNLECGACKRKEMEADNADIADQGR